MNILEILFTIILGYGVCWFIFDISFKRVITFIGAILCLLFIGFVLGFGIHASNMVIKMFV